MSLFGDDDVIFIRGGGEGGEVIKKNAEIIFYK